MGMFKLPIRPAAIVAAAATTALLSGCGSGNGGASPLNDAPAGVAAVYKASCIQCHGTELQGKVGPVTNLQQVGSRMDADEIAKQIRNGSEDGLMQPFGDKLSEEEIKGLAEWLARQK